MNDEVEKCQDEIYNLWLRVLSMAKIIDPIADINFAPLSSKN
jgi:hypothetical protein